MATCPECFERKPFWARRCHSCNEEIGFLRQLYTQWVILTVTFGSMWVFYAAFAGGVWHALFWSLVWVLGPLIIAFPFIFIYFLKFAK